MLLDINTKIFILLLIFYSSTKITKCTIPKWNYYKNGEDWPNSCRKGLQAPIDVVGPFKYRSINKLTLRIKFDIFLLKDEH